MKLDKNQKITAGIAALFLLGGLGAAFWSKATPKKAGTPRPPAVTKVASRTAAPKPQCVCSPIAPTNLSTPALAAAPAAPHAPQATSPTCSPVASAVSTPPAPAIAPATPAGPYDDGWKPVVTKNGWIRLDHSTVPPPKVPVKPDLGADVR